MIEISSAHFPISVNAAFRNVTAKDGKKAGRIKTARYTTWRNAIGWDIAQAMRGKQMIEGHYSVRILLSTAERHPLADLGNFEKGVQDALQEFGVVKNDRYCDYIEMGWANVEGIQIKVWE